MRFLPPYPFSRTCVGFECSAAFSSWYNDWKGARAVFHCLFACLAGILPSLRWSLATLKERERERETGFCLGAFAPLMQHLDVSLQLSHPYFSRSHSLLLSRCAAILFCISGAPPCPRPCPLFCLERLSRHYLPPVAASGEKDKSGVRTTSCTRTVRR